MKNIYTSPELTLTEFESEDVITTSTGIKKDVTNDETEGL